MWILNYLRGPRRAVKRRGGLIEFLRDGLVGWHLATRLVMKILLGSSMKISGLRENQTWNKNRETSQSHLTQTEVRKLKLILLEFKLSRRLLSRCVSATTTWDRSWGQLGEKWKTYQHSYMAATTITCWTCLVVISHRNVTQRAQSDICIGVSW